MQHATKPCLETSIKQTIKKTIIQLVRTIVPRPPSLSARARPVSSLLAPRTPFKGNCLGISFLQIECFYRHSVHCDFLPYDIDTIQSNLLLQQSCISCVSQSHIARRVQLPVRKRGHVSCRQPLCPLAGSTARRFVSRALVEPSEHLVRPRRGLGNCRFSPSEFMLTS